VTPESSIATNSIFIFIRQMIANRKRKNNKTRNSHGCKNNIADRWEPWFWTGIKNSDRSLHAQRNMITNKNVILLSIIRKHLSNYLFNMNHYAHSSCHHNRRNSAAQFCLSGMVWYTRV